MLPFHPYADIFPLVEGDQFADLVADVRQYGVRERVVIFGGQILDGRNRYRAAIAADLIAEDDDPADRPSVFRRFVPDVDGDPLAFVISHNLRRRHLDDGQRASVAAKIANLGRGRPSSENPPDGGISTEQAAAILNVAPRQVERARVVHEYGIDELGDALDRGEITVTAAEKIARLPADEQRAALPNGARSIMSSRVEADDSLDYFPTPPWATRALCRHVFPRLYVGHRTESVWEPACGEGHMAETLCEFFDPEGVAATDVEDYGYGQIEDFLAFDTTSYIPDWIITNPPFGEKTEAFVLRSIALARVGVAMFVRLQWLESIGRYESIFRDHPPTLIAFFTERVNLCKGRWEPEGSTATAYIWLVWVKGMSPRAPFWIPPGCRDTLTHPDDAERFTAHPVIRKEHLPPHDSQTGEIIEPLSPTADGGEPPEALDIPAFLQRNEPEAAGT